MIPIRYQKVFSDETNYRLRAIYEDGSTQDVDPDNMYVLEYLAAGNVPEPVAGNAFVTVTGAGDVTYDRAGAVAAAAKEAWDRVRAIRTQKLADSDWTQLPDAPLTDDQKTTWRTYRQALRDITTQPDPTNIAWPAEPGAGP